MKRNTAVFGVGIGINGREAAIQATQRALDQLGSAHPVLAMVFSAQEFEIQDVLSGLTALLADTPLWGFSTTRPLTGDGDQPRSVVVGLLAGAEAKAQVQWYPSYSIDSAAVARRLAASLGQDVFLPQEILIAADGINGSLMPVCKALGEHKVHVSGCMAAGDPSQGKTFGIGNHHAGAGALTVAQLGGAIRVGHGLAHGWKELGAYFKVTSTRDVWVQTLNNAPAAEMYAQFFGYTAREWAFPPLTDMARLYPLGVEPSRPAGTASIIELDTRNLVIRSAMRVEVDGSLRMSAPVREGAIVHLMTGDADLCLAAAEEAARRALSDLDKARPVMAVALIDTAWQILFEARGSQLTTALKNVLGDIPLIGAYTFGQLNRSDLYKPPVLHNQNIEVLVLGEMVDE